MSIYEEKYRIEEIRRKKYLQTNRVEREVYDTKNILRKIEPLCPYSATYIKTENLYRSVFKKNIEIVQDQFYASVVSKVYIIDIDEKKDTAICFVPYQLLPALEYHTVPLDYNETSTEEYYGFYKEDSRATKCYFDNTGYIIERYLSYLYDLEEYESCIVKSDIALEKRKSPYFEDRTEQNSLELQKLIDTINDDKIDYQNYYFDRTFLKKDLPIAYQIMEIQDVDDTPLAIIAKPSYIINSSKDKYDLLSLYDIKPYWRNNRILCDLSLNKKMQFNVSAEKLYKDKNQAQREIDYCIRYLASDIKQYSKETQKVIDYLYMNPQERLEYAKNKAKVLLKK